MQAVKATTQTCKVGRLGLFHFLYLIALAHYQAILEALDQLLLQRCLETPIVAGQCRQNRIHDSLSDEVEIILFFQFIRDPTWNSGRPNFGGVLRVGKG